MSGNNSARADPATNSDRIQRVHQKGFSFQKSRTQLGEHGGRERCGLMRFNQPQERQDVIEHVRSRHTLILSPPLIASAHRHSKVLEESRVIHQRRKAYTVLHVQEPNEPLAPVSDNDLAMRKTGRRAAMRFDIPVLTHKRQLILPVKGFDGLR